MPSHCDVIIIIERTMSFLSLLTVQHNFGCCTLPTDNMKYQFYILNLMKLVTCIRLLHVAHGGTV